MHICFFVFTPCAADLSKKLIVCNFVSILCSTATARGPVCICACVTLCVCAHVPCEAKESWMWFSGREKKRSSGTFFFLIFSSVVSVKNRRHDMERACQTHLTVTESYGSVCTNQRVSAYRCIRHMWPECVHARRQKCCVGGRTSWNVFLLVTLAPRSDGSSSRSHGLWRRAHFLPLKVSGKVFPSPRKRRLSAGVEQESAAVTTCHRLDVFSHTHARGKSGKARTTKLSAILKTSTQKFQPSITAVSSFLWRQWFILGLKSIWTDSPPLLPASPSVDTEHRNSPSVS